MRIIYKNKSSFDEIMALPTALLDDEYWFPFYNRRPPGAAPGSGAAPRPRAARAWRRSYLRRGLGPGRVRIRRKPDGETLDIRPQMA
jgi:hypothetical protein